MFSLSETRTIVQMTPGQALLEAKLPQDALPFLRNELAFNQDEAYRWSNVAIALRLTGKLDSALEHIDEALRLTLSDSPTRWVFLVVKARILDDLGRFRESLKLYMDAAQLSHNRETAMGLAFAMMREGEGRLAEAIPYWQHCYPIEGPTGVPFWTGGGLEGKRILVTRQGGYGDAIWLLRYLGELKALGAHVTFYGWSALRGLLERHPWIDRYCDGNDSVDEREFDLQVPMTMLGPVVGKWPMSSQRYLTRGGRLADAGELKIGLCHSAEEQGQGRKFRSISRNELEPLREVQAGWFGLQPDEPLDWTINTADVMSKRGFHKTADLIEQLDLVVTCDSAVAHIAAAMGVETWVILPLNSDWKWFLGRNDSVWYPTVRLFRNTDPLSFEPAVSDVKRELEKKMQFSITALPAVEGANFDVDEFVEH